MGPPGIRLVPHCWPVVGASWVPAGWVGPPGLRMVPLLSAAGTLHRTAYVFCDITVNEINAEADTNEVKLEVSQSKESA